MKARLRFLRENEEKINQNQKAQYAGVAASQWLELRLQLLGCGKSGCPNKFYQKISLKFVMKIRAELFIQIHDFFLNQKKFDIFTKTFWIVTLFEKSIFCPKIQF